MASMGVPRGRRSTSQGGGRRGSQSPAVSRGAQQSQGHQHHYRRRTDPNDASTPGPGEYNQDYGTIFRGALQLHRQGHNARGYSALTNRGTMTENESLEEEVARLNSRVEILVRAGADYRERVDDLFAATKQEAEKDAGMTVEQLHDMRVLNERLGQRLEELNAVCAQERGAKEQMVQECETLQTKVGVLEAQVDESRAAQRRVEAELEQTAHDQLEQQKSVSTSLAATSRLENDIADLRQLCDTQKSTISELERQLEDALSRSDAVETLTEENGRLHAQRESLDELLRALQTRNQELEQDTRRLTRDLEELPKQEADRLKQSEAQTAEKLRQLEASNRVLLRDADRRKQSGTEAATRLLASERHCETLENRLAEMMVQDTDGHTTSSTPSLAPLHAKRDQACDPCCDELFENSIRDLRTTHEQLLSEHHLLQEQMRHDKAVDTQVRDLCEELNDEVARLADENETLREGLQSIETTFGRFLPPDETTASPPRIDDIPDRPRHHHNTILNTKDAFVQTPPLAVQRPPSPRQQHAIPGPTVREVQLESEIASLKKQREEERAAATEAFKQKIRELLRQFGREAEVSNVEVQICYPGEVLPFQQGTPVQIRNSQKQNISHDDCSLLRRRTAEADTAERRLEAATQVAQQLQDENEDLKEHVRRLLSSDPAARSVHALLATAIRSAEKRINGTLSRFKNVLRSRAVLVNMLSAARTSLSHMRDLAGEVHLWLRTSLANNPSFLADLHPRLDALCTAIDETRAAHRTIASECLTPWEKQNAGIAADTKKPPTRDIPAELRATEELLSTLWVTFTMPKTLPSLKSDRRLYGPVSPQPRGHGGGQDVMYAPTAHLGSLSPEPHSGAQTRGTGKWAGRQQRRKHSPSSIDAMSPLAFHPDEPGM